MRVSLLPVLLVAAACGGKIADDTASSTPKTSVATGKGAKDGDEDSQDGKRATKSNPGFPGSRDDDQRPGSGSSGSPGSGVGSMGTSGDCGFVSCASTYGDWECHAGMGLAALALSCAYDGKSANAECKCLNAEPGAGPADVFEIPAGPQANPDYLLGVWQKFCGGVCDAPVGPRPYPIDAGH